jgi:hypothetical protein
LLRGLREEQAERQVGSGHRSKRVRWNSDRLGHRRQHLYLDSVGGDGVAAEAVVVVLELAEKVEVEEQPGSADLAQLSRLVSGVVEGCGVCSTSVA